MTTNDPRKKWYTMHVSTTGRYVDEGRYFDTAAEAADDCETRNEEERVANGGTLDGGHHYECNAFCSEHHCLDLAVVPDGMCEWHAAKKAEQDAEDAEDEAALEAFEKSENSH